MTIENVKTINIYHKLVFDRENGSLECVNWAARNWAVADGSSRISCEGKTILILLSFARSDNERRKMHASSLFLEIATFSFAILYIMISQASLCVSSKLGLLN